jgi:glycosyltransferase involved in cell wall biosynthesis
LLVLLYITWSDQIVSKYIADHVVTVSAKDRAFLIDRYGLNPIKVSVIPSGCNLVSVADEAEKLKIRTELGIASSAIVVVFHGLCSHFPNKKAVESIQNYIAPRFAKIDPRVLFLIGGSDCSSYEKANVKSVGSVESLRAFLSAADIAIVPLTFGAGTKLKMFDYMSVSLPIVTTAKGIEGITFEDGKNALVVADVDANFIDRLKYLTDNEKVRKQIGANARKLLEEKYTWDDIGADLVRVYNGILKAS